MTNADGNKIIIQIIIVNPQSFGIILSLPLYFILPTIEFCLRLKIGFGLGFGFG
jgi:hypothetical protein